MSGTYNTKSREEITIEANSLEDDKEYLVCANLKRRIGEAVAAVETKRNRKSWLSPTSTTTIDINIITCLSAVFEVPVAANGVVEEHTVFYDNIEEEEEKRSRVGFCTKFPKDVLQKEYEQ